MDSADRRAAQTWGAAGGVTWQVDGWTLELFMYCTVVR